MHLQQQIDLGMQLCTPCDTFGWHTFCGGCGRRYVGADQYWRICPNKDCRAHVPTDYCQLCGTLVASPFLKRMERGEVDWTAESRQASTALEQILHHHPALATDLLDDCDALDAAELGRQMTEIFGGGAAAGGADG